MPCPIRGINFPLSSQMSWCPLSWSQYSSEMLLNTKFLYCCLGGRTTSSLFQGTIQLFKCLKVQVLTMLSSVTCKHLIWGAINSKISLGASLSSHLNAFSLSLQNVSSARRKSGLESLAHFSLLFLLYHRLNYTSLAEQTQAHFHSEHRKKEKSPMHECKQTFLLQSFQP